MGPHHAYAETTAFLGRVLHEIGAMAYRRRHDDGWTLEFVGPGCRRLTGFEPHDLLDGGSAAYAQMIHPDDRGRVRQAVEAAVERRDSFRLGYRLRRVDGTYLEVYDRGSVRHDVDGSAAIEGFIMQPDEGPAAPSPDEEGYKALVEQSLAGIYLIEGQRFTYVNDRFSEIFGYSTQEILALPTVLDLVYPDDRSLVANNLRGRLEGSTVEVRYEFRGLTRDGRCIHVEVHGKRIDVGDPPRVLGILLDVTERKRAERGVRESEKLEALARMAGGVSHDLNNFLSTIRSTAEVLRMERAGDAALATDLAEIIAAVDRGTGLSQQLSRFARTRPTEEATRSPYQFLSELAEALGPMLGRGIRVDAQLDPGLPDVGMSPHDLHHTLMNLVLNAQDAMPEGGVLTLRAFTGEPEPAASAAVEGRPRVILEVADTGTGIDPENRGSLFEPYFTTKGGTGTGLGLANVWRMVRSAGGAIDVDSTPGSGATFRLTLPAAPAV